MRSILTLVLLSLLLLLPAVDSSASPTDNLTNKSKTIAMNGVTQFAGNAGVRTCLDRIKQVSSFITKNTQSKFLMFLPPIDADRQVTSASFEVQLPSSAIAYASMTAAPTAVGCNALYETVEYWDNVCADVAAQNFPGAKTLGVLQKQINVLEGGPNLKVFLMPAGQQGCVSIKKEVIY